jgi:hypothetical protein
MSRKSWITLHVVLPFQIEVPLPLEGPFYGDDCKITKAMYAWLGDLARALAICDKPGEENLDSSMYWAMVRTQPYNGTGRVKASSQFTLDNEGFEINTEKYHDSEADPLICFFCPGTDWPEGPRIYLSDFRGDGTSAKRKLLESLSLMFYRTLRQPQDDR